MSAYITFWGLKTQENVTHCSDAQIDLYNGFDLHSHVKQKVSPEVDQNDTCCQGRNKKIFLRGQSHFSVLIFFPP